MRYIKPQISDALSASLAIQGSSDKGFINLVDSPSEPQRTTVAAYEADE